MKTMYYISWYDTEATAYNENDNLFNSFNVIDGNTFSVDYFGEQYELNGYIFNVIELGEIKGKTYKEKQESVREKAIEYSHNWHGGTSYRELSDIYAYFEKLAKRYGLVKEFRENGII